jgi:hypothetical protein
MAITRALARRARRPSAIDPGREADSGPPPTSRRAGSRAAWRHINNINAARLPHFARLDARLTYRPGWGGERWAFYADLLNLFNAKNVIQIDSALVLDPASDRPGIIELAQDRGIPFFPSFGIRVWF